MGAGKTIKKILIDKNMTITALAKNMGKPRQTLANTLYQDGLTIKTAMEYGKALGCTLYFKDDVTGREYVIYE